MSNNQSISEKVVVRYTNPAAPAMGWINSFKMPYYAALAWVAEIHRVGGSVVILKAKRT